MIVELALGLLDDGRYAPEVLLEHDRALGEYHLEEVVDGAIRRHLRAVRGDLAAEEAVHQTADLLFLEANTLTEHGAVMLASVLNSPTAVAASIQVVRAFVRLRAILATHKDLARKLAEMEKKYDSQFRAVFDVIRKLMEPPSSPPRRPLGF